MNQKLTDLVFCLYCWLLRMLAKMKWRKHLKFLSVSRGLFWVETRYTSAFLYGLKVSFGFNCLVAISVWLFVGARTIAPKSRTSFTPLSMFIWHVFAFCCFLFQGHLKGGSWSGLTDRLYENSYIWSDKTVTVSNTKLNVCLVIWISRQRQVVTLSPACMSDFWWLSKLVKTVFEENDQDSFSAGFMQCRRFLLLLCKNRPFEKTFCSSVLILPN